MADKWPMKFAYSDMAATHKMEDFHHSSVGMISTAQAHAMTR